MNETIIPQKAAELTQLDLHPEVTAAGVTFNHPEDELKRDLEGHENTGLKPAAETTPVNLEPSDEMLKAIERRDKDLPTNKSRKWFSIWEKRGSERKETLNA